MEKISILKETWLKKEIAKLKDKGISKADIACMLGIKPQYLNNILNGGRGITDVFLDKFIEEFNVSQFDLYISENNSILESRVVHKSDPKDIAIIADKQTIIERNAEILAANKETIETQRELISTLKQRISDLERNSSTVRSDAFPAAHSAASTGRTSQSKKTK